LSRAQDSQARISSDTAEDQDNIWGTKSWILKETGENKTEGAKALGIDRVSLWRKLKKYEME